MYVHVHVYVYVYVYVHVYVHVCVCACTTVSSHGNRLARFSCVCKEWQTLGGEQVLWRDCCLQLWRESVALRHVARFGSHWKRVSFL